MKRERDISRHLGLQEINEKNKIRKKVIEESYSSSMEEISKEKGNNIENSLFKLVSLFKVHYSNLLYTCNYLIRIFPYSLIGIEYRGDGFDSPNKLFNSIKTIAETTLNKNFDLREMIPEIYFFPFYYNILLTFFY